ncbi:MAG: 4,5:9,10-diseco-3-hydroxy-5,9,17-trioxoandrosta-1(10),2-diene-4-oate hydrolase [Myxococcota bacterium]|jgi:4,5:9,10-diseco-3-hydroxy-5,9,17-trioxoandrosta-1(10),2-diene-4-oate hydrolase
MSLIHHREEGAADAPVVVFLHGSGPGASGWSNFHQNVPPLVEAGFRVLVPDLLGYGASDKPTDTPYTLAHHASTISDWLDGLGISRCCLIGNSMGGAVATQLTLDRPERVERLVLMAPGGMEDKEAYMAMRGIRRMMRCIYGPEGITLQGMEKVFELQLHELFVPAEVVARRTEVALTQPRYVFETMHIPNISDRLGEITCPVLGLWGADDQFCPVSGATTLARSIADCSVTIFSRCGHWVMVEKQAEFDRLVGTFLQETSLQ